MIIEFFIAALLALKAFGFLEISWTTTCVISFALVAVDIQMYFNKKALLNGLVNGAKVIDNKLEDFEFRLESKQDRVSNKDDSGWN